MEWTPNETGRTSQRDKIYLNEPFLNAQVSWDSEFYLSIATVGYDDPAVRPVSIPNGNTWSMNYAFFPFYPLAMSVVRAPLTLMDLSPIGASALAGVIISLLGTLAGMYALYHLTKDELGEDGALRSVFYLLIFPSAFFLAQVYTEGLFIGLAFSALVFVKRKQLLIAAVLAVLATWTRSVGVLLAIPLFWAWASAFLAGERSFKRVLAGWPVILPFVALGIWYLVMGTPFREVEEHWFGRGLFNMDSTMNGWGFALNAIANGEISEMAVYYLLELLSVLGALVACLATLRRYPGIALFGLATLLISVTSATPQSLIRYVLVIPSIYIALSRLGRWPVFDRLWTVASILLMGLLLTLFTFDMWVA